MMDINAIKQRLLQLGNKTKKQNDIWKPTDEHVVRLLPVPGREDPFIELYFHYEIGAERPILCPKSNFNDECAICDACEKLKSWKRADGSDKPESERKVDWDLFKKISSKPSWFVPMVERGQEAQGAKYWRISQSTLTQILEICSNQERNEDRDDSGGILVVVSTTKAYDLEISFRKPGEKGNSKTFAQTVVSGKMKTSALDKDPKKVEQVLKSIRTIEEVYPKVSSEQVQRMFDNFIGGASTVASAEISGGQVTLKPRYESRNAEKPITGGLLLDEAFEQLANDE